MKIVFVVLHYCVARVTEACVQSLLSLEGDKNIVVVDNASPDGSGLYLKKLYEKEKLVQVLLNKKNVGFADGNNLGYRFAKKELHADTIVVLNNDTLIKDNCFLNKLFEDDSLLDYHIIAPDIITFKGIHQNPYKMKGVTKGEEIKLRNRKKLSILFYSLPFLYKLKSHEVVNREGPFIDKRIEDVVPHGAAVIFMNKWVEREEFAFYPGTFMYYEEDLLYVYAKSKDYKTIYVPSLQITHLEDMSTNSTQKNIRKKMLFQNKQKAHSLDVIINYMKGQE